MMDTNIADFFECMQVGIIIKSPAQLAREAHLQEVAFPIKTHDNEWFTKAMEHLAGVEITDIDLIRKLKKGEAVRIEYFTITPCMVHFNDK